MLCQEPRAIKGFGDKSQWFCQVEQNLAMSASSVLPEVKVRDIAFFWVQSMDFQISSWDSRKNQAVETANNLATCVLYSQEPKKTARLN
jgi:hypothetical protein